MDSLFGVPLTSILTALLLMVGVIFGVLVFIAWRNPLLVRMGIRNITRRKAQTVLIVIGLMLSTLIISAAFATGDTVGYSVTNLVYEELGEADLVVVFDSEQAPEGQTDLSEADVESVRQIFAGDPDVETITGMIQTPIPAVNQQARLSSPRALFVGVDAATADPLKGLVTPDGEEVSVSALGPDQAYITEDLAEEIDLGAGGSVTVYYGNQPHEFTVAAIVRDNAMTAQNGGMNPGGGVVVPIDSLRSVATDQDLNLIVISVAGGVRDSLDLAEEVEDRLDAAIEDQGLPLEVVASKPQLVGFAELAGSLFVTFFLVFGLFSMAAGVMLIFLTFIMLAAERRAEMGMARAVGMKRLHLTESFIAEGMTYNLGSAFVGSMLGLAVAYGLIAFLGSVADDFGLGITFHVNPVGFLISYFLGVVITFVTVAAASWRAANLNIVRAIRDIPEPEPLKANDTSVGVLLKATLGAAWYLVWVGIVALASLLVFLAFIFSLSAYGIPLIGVGLVLAAFIWGVREFGRSRGDLRLILFITWWVIFFPTSVVVFLLQRSKPWADRHRNSGGWAILMLIVGLLATWWGGWIAGQAFAYTAGTTLVILAVAMLATYFGAPARPVFATASFVTLWYWLLPMPFSLLFEDGKGWTDPLDGFFGLFGLGHDPIVGNIEMFFVSGVCITAASTLFVIFNADRLLGTLGVLRHVFGGITPAVRTAISYPLASKLRTGMTLAMFTLVMFSLVVMATLNHNFTQLFLGDGARGGFDIQVATNPNNPIEDLGAALGDGGYDVDANISAIGRLSLGFPEMKPADEADDEYFEYSLAGVDSAFAAAADFPMTTVADGYADAQAVMEALGSDPTVAVANEMILDFSQRANFVNPDDVFSVEGSITDLQDAPWGPIPVVIRDEETGEERTVNIIGFVDSAIISGIVPQWLSVFVNEAVVMEVTADPAQFYFVDTVTEGEAPATEVANGIESTLLERGVQADSLRQLVKDSTTQSDAFSLLFLGFMSLGLIVGIAALGVIAFRTVAERRQQIGMLRAIGYSRKLVAITFFLESSFIAVAGIGMGLILGAALSYNLMTSPDFTNGAEIHFSFPLGRILLIVGIAYAASALMTLIPARSASRVAVAEALRYSA